MHQLLVGGRRQLKRSRLLFFLVNTNLYGGDFSKISKLI
jgi:hypothetical protein